MSDQAMVRYCEHDAEATLAIHRHFQLKSMQRQREILNLPFEVRFEKAMIALRLAWMCWKQSINPEQLDYYQRTHAQNARRQLFKARWLLLGKVNKDMAIDEIPVL